MKISGFKALNFANFGREIVGHNEKLEKAFFAIKKVFFYTGARKYGFNNQSFVNVLPSVYAKNYKSSDFNQLFPHFGSFISRAQAALKILSNADPSSLDDIRATAQILRTNDRDGEVTFLIFIHDDETQESVRLVNYYLVSGFAKKN